MQQHCITSSICLPVRCGQEKILCLFSPRMCFGKTCVIRKKRPLCIFLSFNISPKIQAPSMFLKSLSFLPHATLAVLPSLPYDVNM